MFKPTPKPWKEFIDDAGDVWIVGPDHKVEWVGDELTGYPSHTGVICYIGNMENTDGVDHSNVAFIVQMRNKH